MTILSLQARSQHSDNEGVVYLRFWAFFRVLILEFPVNVQGNLDF